MADCRGEALRLLCPVILLLSLFFKHFGDNLFGDITHEYCETGFSKIGLLFNLDGKENALYID